MLAGFTGQGQGQALAQSTSDADQSLLESARRAQPAVIESLQEMVLIESGSQDLEGLAKMAQLVDNRLRRLGFATERRKTTAGAGADIVIGSLHGTGRRRIMLQGHMDTVYQSGILQTQPYKVDGNRIYGPGIADDKGGLAVILHALQILLDSGWKDFDTLTVLVDPDEEVGSIGSGELIASLGAEHDAVLSFEPTAAKAVGKTESVLLGAAGLATVHLEVKGRAAHAGAAPQLGRNALLELSHQLLQTRDLPQQTPGATLNWTTAKAGTVTNQIPEHAEADGDMRITRTGADQKLFELLRARIDGGKLIPDTEDSVSLIMGRPVYVATPAGRTLAEKARSIYAELGQPLALVEMSGGGTDAGYANRSGKAAVLESLGLAGFGYHARDEYIEIDSIAPRLYLTARLLTEIGKQP